MWAADITYLPIGRGFLDLVAIIDWASRAALAWRISNTMDTSFCLAALDDALARYGRPEIFNTDQGSQLTSAAFTGALAGAGIKISMDGRGRWMAPRMGSTSACVGHHLSRKLLVADASCTNDDHARKLIPWKAPFDGRLAT